MKIDNTVKQETLYLASFCAIFSVLMQAVFLIIGQWSVYVLLGNLWGYLAAVGNFFLMGLTVQKAVLKPEDEARTSIKLSQTLRNMLLLIVIVIGIAVPFLNTWSVIIPLFFPRISILIRGLTIKK